MDPKAAKQSPTPPASTKPVSDPRSNKADPNYSPLRDPLEDPDTLMAEWAGTLQAAPKAAKTR